MNKIKSFCKRVRIDIILRAILLLVMAVLFFISPEDAITSATLVLSIFIICDGVFSFVLYFFTGGLSGLFGSTLLGAIFKILFGILLAINLDVSTTIFSLMFACYVIVVSANTIEESMYFEKSWTKLDCYINSWTSLFSWWYYIVIHEPINLG